MIYFVVIILILVLLALVYLMISEKNKKEFKYNGEYYSEKEMEEKIVEPNVGDTQDYDTNTILIPDNVKEEGQAVSTQNEDAKKQTLDASITERREVKREVLGDKENNINSSDDSNSADDSVNE